MCVHSYVYICMYVSLYVHINALMYVLLIICISVELSVTDGSGRRGSGCHREGVYCLVSPFDLPLFCVLCIVHPLGGSRMLCGGKG